jgi:hypothetical protein
MNKPRDKSTSKRAGKSNLPETAVGDDGLKHNFDPRIPPLVEPFPAFKDQICKCRPDQTPWWKSVAEFIALAIGVAVAVIYYGQLQTMKQALAVDQRAWVGAKSFVILNPPLEANKPIQIGLDYWNFGKTPALDVSGYVQPNFVTSEAKLDFSKWGEPLEAQRSVMFPSSSNHLLITVPQDLPGYPPVSGIQGIPAPVFSELANGKSFIYIYGNLGYDDVLGFHHWTHFCLRYSFPSNGFVYCDTFNSVDEELR